MIRFACPRCRAVFQCPDDKAGKKSSCPKCGQRLQIPIPPRSKTILAPLLPPSTTGLPVASIASMESPAGDGPYPQTIPEQPVSEQPVAEEPRPRLPLPRRLMMGGCAVLVTVGLLGSLALVVYAVSRIVFPPAGQVAEERSHTRTDAEELVATWIRNNSDKPETITFRRWGPHMTRQELLDLLREAGLEDLVAKAKKENLDSLPDVTIRVVFRRPTSTQLSGNFIVWGIDRGKEVAPQVREYDLLVPVRGKLILSNLAVTFNKEGDRWKEKDRENLAKFFPAVRVKK